MNFVAVLLALVLEQFKPLPRDNWLHHTLAGWVHWVGRNFDAGRESHAWVAWCISVLLPGLGTAALFLLLSHFSVLLALAFNVAVLYATLGFRQFSHYFTDIRVAFEEGDEDEARRLLAEWRHLDVADMPRTELLRHVIEHALLAAHRHVFGVFFWFVVLSTLGLGPTGAVLYRMAEFAGRFWSFPSKALGVPANERLLAVSQRLFALIDHVPARLTAAGFALAGNFEETVSGWRRDAALWRHSNEGVILAAAAGAVGVRLGGHAAPGMGPERSRTFEAGVASADVHAAGTTGGVAPQTGHLRSVVGLVWRSLVVWMLLLLVLTGVSLVSRGW